MRRAWHLCIPILFAVFAIWSFSAATTTGSLDKIALHRTVHFIEQTTVSDGALCTGTAIGPHALLTATHCELASDTLVIGEGASAVKAHIERRIRDEQDHTIYLLTGVKFKDIAEFSVSEVQQGDHLFFWGNPGDERDQYREGIVMGHVDIDKRDAVLIDMRAHAGDSGSALFNADGKIVGVLSGLYGDKQMVASDMFPMQFKESQIKTARSF